jgi:hypothetical protein
MAATDTYTIEELLETVFSALRLYNNQLPVSRERERDSLQADSQLRFAEAGN